MTRFRADNNYWTQEGKKAANDGKLDEALYALCALMTGMFGALEIIIDNQFEIYAAITNAGKGTPVNGRRP
jgi:hypothetical protein